MEKNKPLNIYVLGAGPSGLCAAWNLAKDGHRVTVLEKESVCGGQSITFQKGAYRYDLGPHNVHPRRKSIINFLKTNLGDEFVSHEFFAQIYFRGRRINYPFTGWDVLKSMDVFTMIHCGLSFIFAHFISFFIPKFKDDGSFKSWIINRFGRKFYNIYFGPYTKKVWGIDPAQLSDVVAKKRVVVRGIIELLHLILFQKKLHHPENPRMIENFYPQNGIGAISDFFVDGITKAGGQILTESSVKKIVVEKNQIRKILYEHKGETKSIDLDKEKNCEVLSTLPLDEMIIMMEGDTPPAVVKAAQGLDFTSEVFLYLNLKREHVFEAPLFYFSEEEFPFNRIYDVGIFSKKMVPKGKTALCIEITCNRGDDKWNMDDKEIFEKCIVPLEKHNLLHRDDVEGYHTRRMAHAYPRFRIGYKEKLDTIFDYCEQLSNFITFGRQGLFAYVNVDDAIWMGFEVAKHLNYRQRIVLPMKELLPEYISF